MSEARVIYWNTVPQDDMEPYGLMLSHKPVPVAGHRVYDMLIIFFLKDVDAGLLNRLTEMNQWFYNLDSEIVVQYDELYFFPEKLNTNKCSINRAKKIWQ